MWPGCAGGAAPASSEEGPQRRVRCAAVLRHRSRFCAGGLVIGPTAARRTRANDTGEHRVAGEGPAHPRAMPPPFNPTPRRRPRPIASAANESAPRPARDGKRFERRHPHSRRRRARMLGRRRAAAAVTLRNLAFGPPRPHGGPPEDGAAGDGILAACEPGLGLARRSFADDRRTAAETAVRVPRQGRRGHRSRTPGEPGGRRLRRRLDRRAGGSQVRSNRGARCARRLAPRCLAPTSL
jgi:hypothetical protein